ncbi:FecCD family ABC transporter permease [Cohnella zeiphila]|uniref:Iron chelate uptake ABC transporter family permease subunit n=1 Tax=Cohnella zeiphila TaxID=2761120 RepID=A0A7X0SJF2_9BACL|nr:iron chelate uptake ABC transporter family permease subunit [Cohnella zeiphila]MBB6731071.1 iron chelate uptake ABC transporter family permease subunit [Cohnella zeiphila]
MRRTTALAAAFLLMLLLTAVSLRFGAVAVPWRHIGETLLGRPNPSSFVVDKVRLPRIATAVLAGFGLAVSGVILQSLLRNPLASPDVVGVSKGAGFAAAAVLFLYPRAPAFALPAAAFAGAFAAFALLLTLSRRLRLGPAALALVGVAVGAVFQAGTQYLIVRHPTDINLALLWLTGSLWGRSWSHVLLLLPWIAALLPLAWSGFAKLNLLQLTDEVAVSLGLRIVRERLWLILLAVALAGIAVAAVGAIGFVGLVAPHMARRIVGSRHQWLIPLAALLGADLMLLGDVLGRVLIVPREVPVGIMSAVIGAPYFVYLLRKAKDAGARGRTGN